METTNRKGAADRAAIAKAYKIAAAEIAGYAQIHLIKVGMGQAVFRLPDEDVVRIKMGVAGVTRPNGNIYLNWAIPKTDQFQYFIVVALPWNKVYLYTWDELLRQFSHSENRVNLSINQETATPFEITQPDRIRKLRKGVPLK
ncbi:MAG: hypothetical protein CMK74_05940 [Pseudomonadales bacterium]|nr:hypothetical protein [Pseudomonadales bacterium]